MSETPMTPIRKVLEAIQAERVRQDAQWGGPEHDDTHNLFDWVDFIVAQAEKFGQQTLARGEAYWATPDARQRLVKIAALAVAALESLERKDGAVPDPPRRKEPTT